MTRVLVPEIRKVRAHCSFLKLSAFNDHLKKFSMFLVMFSLFIAFAILLVMFSFVPDMLVT